MLSLFHKIINWNKIILFVMNLSFFDSFLVFLEYLQLKHVSSIIQDQFLITVIIFQFQKVQS